MEIKSSEREPFIKVLQRLRPDLQKTVSELEDQLEILKDDIADLLGRLQYTGIPQEWKLHVAERARLVVVRIDDAVEELPGAFGIPWWSAS